MLHFLVWAILAALVVLSWKPRSRSMVTCSLWLRWTSIASDVDEEDANQRIAKAARPAAAKAIEGRKTATAPPVIQSVSQFEHVAPSPKGSESGDQEAGPQAS